MRATVEHQENWPSLTPIEVIVVLGKEDLTIKVTILCVSFESLLRQVKMCPKQSSSLLLATDQSRVYQVIFK